MCMPECEERCQCNEGYYRNDDGACVLASECPNECGENEIWTDCSSCSGKSFKLKSLLTWTAEPSCEEEYPVCADCSPGSECCMEKGCICADGFKRKDYNQCVPENQCTSIPPTDSTQHECGPNEVWIDCQTCSGFEADRVITYFNFTLTSVKVQRVTGLILVVNFKSCSLVKRTHIKKSRKEVQSLLKLRFDSP